MASEKNNTYRTLGEKTFWKLEQKEATYWGGSVYLRRPGEREWSRPETI